MHSGFNRSWTKNNLNGRVIDRVLQIVREAPGHQDPDRKFRIMVSGEHRCTLLTTAAELLPVSAHSPLAKLKGYDTKGMPVTHFRHSGFRVVGNMHAAACPVCKQAQAGVL